MDFIRNPNQQDLSWFIDMKTQNRLELDPNYQRLSVWTNKDKQFFLDTIFNNYPCPAVYLQKENTASGPLYNVVDGKQRLSTILHFYAGKIRIHKEFSIVSMRGKKFDDLSKKQKSDFYNYIIMVEQIRAEEAEEAVDWGEVFQRVNKNQKKLTDQELRHARFDGWLISSAENETDNKNDEWRMLGISSPGRARRMKDVELISILMLVCLEKKFIGFPQHAIDKLYAKYNFKTDELPDTAADIELADEEDNSHNFTKENVAEFEKEFAIVRNFIVEMEKSNNCISNHKQRITTDFYSLWAAISLDEDIRKLGPDKLAVKYNSFMKKVELAFSNTKEGKNLANLDANIQTYHTNSIGAATEVAYREKRHNALIEFLLK